MLTIEQQERLEELRKKACGDESMTVEECREAMDLNRTSRAAATARSSAKKAKKSPVVLSDELTKAAGDMAAGLFDSPKL